MSKMLDILAAQYDLRPIDSSVATQMLRWNNFDGYLIANPRIAKPFHHSDYYGWQAGLWLNDSNLVYSSAFYPTAQEANAEAKRKLAELKK